MMVPTENAKPIGPIDQNDAAKWCALGTLLVPYGGFLAAGLQPGETVLVSGATGNFGSAAVAVALAMGAACVVAPGRNERMLADLARRFGSRVRTVWLSGHEDDDRERMKQAAGGPIDCVLDILPPSVSATVARAAIMTVRPYGQPYCEKYYASVFPNHTLTVSHPASMQRDGRAIVTRREVGMRWT
jgi:alcohol dehydrogenase